MLSIDTCQLTTFFGQSWPMRPSRNPRLIRAFSAVLKARRLELQLTQEDLAGRCEIDRPFVTLMEGGSKHPTLSVFWRLAHGLELTAGDFATRIDDALARSPAAVDAMRPGLRVPTKRAK